MPNSQEPDRSAKRRFLYPLRRYRGKFSPHNLAFNANLQEFAQHVEFICALETNGKIEPFEAYKQIKSLYKQLKTSKKNLRVGDEPPPKATD